MGKNISLFSGYSQKENRTTNYTLLILKLLYEENPKYLGELFSFLIDENIGNLVGVKFNQQVNKKISIPDGLVTQSSFNIYIETKNFDWFYDKQLSAHLEAISKEKEEIKILIALGNFEEDSREKFTNIDNICKTKYKNEIIFTILSFEEILEGLNSINVPKNLKDLILEYENYLNEENLLPYWKYTLDVINCAGFPDDILDYNVYMCPASGGAYSHSRAKFFGMYRNKTVENIAHIDAVIDIIDEETIETKWINTKEKSKKKYEDKALKILKDTRNEYPTRVFLLGELYNTNFVKDSNGGMMNSKLYFYFNEYKDKTPFELAEFLKNKKWSDYKK